jgi:adenylate cyclase
MHHMAEERAQRRLTVILAADIVGYSRLMEADEANTLAAIKYRRRDILEPLLVRYRGHIVKTTGDGLLAEFASAINAVECAVALQSGMTAANANLPEDRYIVLRVGINLGDVVIQDGDLYGDAVNIAARLEAIAAPGSVYVSGKIRDEVHRRLHVDFEDLGQQVLKNIVKPIRVYRISGMQMHVLDSGISLPTSSNPSIAGVSHTTLPQSKRPSVAVLPFTNISGDPQQDYLAYGITEDLTTELARVPGLFVMSRNATLPLKTKAARSFDVAKELGVRYILEGSVRRLGSEVRINAQLADAISGGHVWAERFDGSLNNIFSLQDTVIKNVAAALELRLVAPNADVRTGGETRIPAAYDAFLQGLELDRRDTPDAAAKAISHLERAIDLDPTYGRAYALLAGVYWGAIGQWEDALGISREVALSKAKAYLAEAKKRPTALAYRISAAMSAADHNFDEAIAELERAIALDPNDPFTHRKMAYMLTTIGRAADGEKYVVAALRVDPRLPVNFVRGMIHFCMDRFEEAAACLQVDVAEYPDNPYPLILLAATYGHLSRELDARSSLEKMDMIAGRNGLPGATQDWVKMLLPLRRQVDVQRLLSGLDKAGMSASVHGDAMQMSDALKDERSKAIPLA